MNYKVYVSAYLEETEQLLVSFSSDDTDREAIDYQSLAFDLVPYGNIPVQDVLTEIAKAAPTVCSDIKTQEVYVNDDDRSSEFRALVGQSFEYSENDLFNSEAATERAAQAEAEAEEAEEI